MKKQDQMQEKVNEFKTKIRKEVRDKKINESRENYEKIKTEIIGKDPVFADPTYDTTFKMLFGNQKNADILISILNSLLNFIGDEKIKEVEIQANELPTEGAKDIQGAVDVLCITENKQKIAIEMQRKHKDYFLFRVQEYMSKLIMGQIKDGEGNEYPLMDTYILSIGKQNIFRGKTALKNQKIFESTVVPWVIETNEELPNNKLHWKFYELTKFKNAYKKAKTKHGTHSLKEQWLNFLVECGQKDIVPDNIDNIIKKAYNIMKMANWKEGQRALYWKEKANEKDFIEQHQIELKNAQLKGEIKGEFKQIKSGLEWKIEDKKIQNKLIFTKKHFVPIKNYLNEGHFDDTEVHSRMKRNIAESNIGVLKEFSSLNLSRHRSYINDMIHIIAALVAYQLYLSFNNKNFCYLL